MPHVCPYIWPMYARMHAPLLPPYGLCIRPCMPQFCSHVAHICAHVCPIAAPMWPIYARMYPPLSGTKIRTIRKAVKKRQALYLIWTSAVIAHVCAAIYAGKNGPYFEAVMGSYMGHIWEHQWGIYRPHGSSKWGMHARIHGHIWEQPYRESREEGNSRESLPFLGSGKGIAPGLSLPFPAPSSREGKGREGNPYPIPQRKLP